MPVLPPKPPRRHQPAFTLIELLVVIAIIAILAAIAMPAYSGMVGSGKSTKCLSNMRQIGVAMLGYTAENNGHFPETSDESWAKYLGAYFPTRNDLDVGNVKDLVFRCPAETKVPPANFAGSVNHYTATPAIGKAGSVKNGPGTLAAVTNPSQTLLVVDGHLSPNNNSGYNSGSACSYSEYKSDCGKSDPATTENVAFRHRNTSMNALYVDGHVGTIPWSDRTNVTKLSWQGIN